MSGLALTPEHETRLAALESGGRLTPRAVVDDAKSPDSPLHGLFDWDADKAADAHWLERARTIIRSVRIHAADPITTVLQAPYYVSDPTLPNEQGYISVALAKRDPLLAKETLRVEFGRALSALTRARRVAEALGLSNELEALIANVTHVRDKAA